MEFIKNIFCKIKYFFIWINIYKRLSLHEKNTLISLKLIINETAKKDETKAKFDELNLLVDSLDNFYLELSAQITADHHSSCYFREIQIKERASLIKTNERINGFLRRNKKRNAKYKNIFKRQEDFLATLNKMAIVRLSFAEKRITLLELKENKSTQTGEIPSLLE